LPGLRTIRSYVPRPAFLLRRPSIKNQERALRQMQDHYDSHFLSSSFHVVRLWHRALSQRRQKGRVPWAACGGCLTPGCPPVAPIIPIPRDASASLRDLLPVSNGLVYGRFVIAAPGPIS
jgi:hypothetical protein